MTPGYFNYFNNFRVHLHLRRVKQNNLRNNARNEKKKLLSKRTAHCELRYNSFTEWDLSL